MELKNGYVWWNENETEKVHGQIVKIEPLKDNTGKQKLAKNGKPKSRILFRTEEYGDVMVVILDTQRTFFDPQLGKRGYIIHNNLNNYLTFEEDDDVGGGVAAEYVPQSIEDLFQFVQDEAEEDSLESVMDEVENDCDRINELLNERISVENEVNSVYLRRVRDANIRTVKEILELRMKGII